MLKWETGILTPGDSLMSETLAEWPKLTFFYYYYYFDG